MSEEMENSTIEPGADTQGNAEGAGQKHEERMFTDAYVKARIDKQNRKHAEELAERDARIAELESTSKANAEELEALKHEKELAQWAQEAAKEAGVPASVLRGNSLEEMKAHASEIAAAMQQKPTAPVVKDSGAPAQAPTTLDDIRAIEDPKSRREALKAHPELFS